MYHGYVGTHGNVGTMGTSGTHVEYVRACIMGTSERSLKDFCASTDSHGLGKRYGYLTSLLGVYSNAEKALLAYTLSKN